MKKRQTLMLATAMAGLLVAQVPPALAADTSALPPVQTHNGITYMTGGIGQTESTAMRDVAGRYDLAITFAESNGSFLSAVPVQIQDSRGKTVLSVTSDPILLVDLPNGTYKVKATVADITRERTVNVGRGHDRIAYTWPESVGDSSSFAAFEVPRVNPRPMAPPVQAQPVPQRQPAPMHESSDLNGPAFRQEF